MRIVIGARVAMRAADCIGGWCHSKIGTMMTSQLMKIWLLPLIATLAIKLASAQAAAAPDYNPEVMAALIKFTEAMEAGDAKAMEKMIYVETLAQERLRNAIVPLAAAEKALERAALARFGEEGKKFRCGFDTITTGTDRKTLASAKISYDEVRRNAHVERAGE